MLSFRYNALRYSDFRALKIEEPDAELSKEDLIRQRNHWWDRAREAEREVISNRQEGERIELLERMAEPGLAEAAVREELEQLRDRHSREWMVFTAVHQWRDGREEIRL